MAKNKQRKSNKALLTVIIGICIGIMAFSGYQLIKIGMTYKTGTDEYNGLREYTSYTGETVIPEASVADVSETDTSEDGEKDQAEQARAPISVDFEELKAINEDIIGWIYYAAIDLSYPVVQGEDDSYYLNHTFEKTYNPAGCVFLEAQNSADLEDPNSILYGHRMKNQSMFGKLSWLTSKELYKEDPYFWILTPEGDRCYKVFSLQVTATGSEVYTLFGGRDYQFMNWIDSMKDLSSVPLEDPTYSLTSNVVTLSTCTGDPSTRLVVQGMEIK